VNSTETRVRTVIERAFKIPRDNDVDYAMGALQGWDSLGHMQLIVALEQEFGVNIPSYALSEMVDITSIVRIVEEHS
jgi:acyl carrier protein